MRISYGAEHPAAVEIHRDMSVAIDGDDAAFAAEALQLAVDHFMDRRRERQVFVAIIEPLVIRCA